MTLKANVFARKDEGRGLVLITNGKRVVEPVRDICAPLNFLVMLSGI